MQGDITDSFTQPSEQLKKSMTLSLWLIWCPIIVTIPPARFKSIFEEFLKHFSSENHQSVLYTVTFQGWFEWRFSTDSLSSCIRITFYHLLPTTVAKCENSFSPCKPLKALFQTIKVKLSSPSSHKSDLNKPLPKLADIDKVGLKRSRELISLPPQLSPWTQLFAPSSKALLMMSASSWSHASDFINLLRNLCAFTWILRYGWVFWNP